MVSWFTQLTNKQKISSLIPGETQILLGFYQEKNLVLKCLPNPDHVELTTVACQLVLG